MNQAEVAALKERLKKEYEENVAAIERVEKLLASGATVESPTVAPSASPMATNADGPQDTPTTIRAVEQWFRAVPNRTFTVEQLLKNLNDQQFKFESINPRKSVHTAVWRLEKNGVVRTVLRGKGRRPSTYQLASNVENPKNAAPLNGAPPGMEFKHGALVPTHQR
jgi:hypothetical protein